MNDDEYIAKARVYARLLAPHDAEFVYGLIHRLTAANADAAKAWRWVDVMDTDRDEAEIYGALDRDRDAHIARIGGK